MGGRTGLKREGKEDAALSLSLSLPEGVVLKARCRALICKPDHPANGQQDGTMKAGHGQVVLECYSGLMT